MRLKILILCLLAAIAPMTAGEHPKPAFGVTAAFELMVPSGATSYFNIGTTFLLGGTVRVPIKNSFFFEPGLLFAYTAMDGKDAIPIDDSLYYGDAKEYGLRLPLKVGYAFQAGDNWIIEIYTGPWINFNLRARQTLDPNFSAPVPVPDKTINLMKHGWKRVDAMWGLALSATFAKSYRIGLCAGAGITPLAKFGNRDRKIKVHRIAIGISLGYIF